MAMRGGAGDGTRVSRGVEVVYVPDACNPSDFLTKWVPAAKEAISDAYTRGTPHGASGDEAT